MERYYDILIKISLVISVLTLIGTTPYWISKIRRRENILYKKKYARYYDEHKTLDIEQLYYKRATLKYDVFFSTGIPALVALFIFIMTIAITYSIAKDSIYTTIKNSETSELGIVSGKEIIETVNLIYNMNSIVLIVLVSIVFISIAIVTKLYGDSTLKLAIVENCLEMKKENIEH